MFNGITDSIKSFGHKASEMFDSTPKEAGDAMGEKAGEYKKYTEDQAHKTADAIHGASADCQEWLGEVEDDVKEGAKDLQTIAGNAAGGVASSMEYTFEHVNQSRHDAATYLRNARDDAVDTCNEDIEEANVMRGEFSDAFAKSFQKAQHLEQLEV